MLRRVLVVLACLLVTWLGWALYQRLSSMGGGTGNGMRGDGGPAPVEVAEVERGPILLRRQFSGALEAYASMAVAPKVAGRIERLSVEMADQVTRGQVVAELDHDEYEQAVAQSEAELAVARANLSEARSRAEIARRELGRIQTLVARGVASESERDAGEADALAREAAVEVAAAEVIRSEASLAGARIRLGYTQVRAEWSEGGDRRLVAERYAQEGDTVGANTPLMRIVEIQPIKAVIFVTERDYHRLTAEQTVTLRTDALPGREFTGRVSRVAPVFEEDSRQARVEVTVENPDRSLKPGMFIRALVVLDRAEQATIVPQTALTTRDQRTGVFVVDAQGKTVRWQAVTIGITDGDRVQVIGPGVEGRVVTLGQQLVADGSGIVIREDRSDYGGAPRP